MLNKIKTSAGLEAAYFQRKSRDDFTHEGEIDTHVKLLRIIRSGIKLRTSLHTFHDKTKEANNAENNTGTLYSSAGGEHSVDHWTILGRGFIDATIQKQALIEAVSKVNEEWKAFETSDVKKVLQLEDQCNRALSDKEYYAKHDPQSVPNAEKNYQETGQKLIAGVKELSDASTKLFAQWSKRIVEAEVAYHMAAAGVWQQAAKDMM